MSDDKQEIVYFTPSVLTFSHQETTTPQNSKDTKDKQESTDCAVHEILTETVRFTNPTKTELRYVINGFIKGKNYWISCTKTDFVLKPKGSTDIKIFAFLRNSSSEERVDLSITMFPIENKRVQYDKYIKKDLVVLLLPALSEYLEFSECSLDFQIYEGLFNAIYKGTYRSLDVAISKVKSREEEINKLEALQRDLHARGEELSASQLKELNEKRYKRDNGYPEEDNAKEFVEEIKQIAALQRNLISPYILTFVGMTEYPFAAITELAPYGDAESLYEKYHLSDMLKYKIFEDISKGVAACHQVDIMHLDLKPANIFVFSLNPYDSVVAKLADFGAAKRVNFDNPPPGLNLVSTALYTPPEVMLFQQVNGCPMTKKAAMLNELFGLAEKDCEQFIYKKGTGSAIEEKKLRDEKARKLELFLYKNLGIGLSIDVFCFALTMFEILIERPLIYTKEFDMGKVKDNTMTMRKIFLAKPGDKKTKNVRGEEVDYTQLIGFPMTLDDLKVPEWFRDIIDHCWAINPRDRYTMNEIAAKFQHETSHALDKLNDRQQSLLLQMTNYKKYTDLRNKAVANYSLTTTMAKQLDKVPFEKELTMVKMKLKPLLNDKDWYCPGERFDITNTLGELVLSANELNIKMYSLYIKKTAEEVQQFKRRNMKIRFDYEISWGAKASEILEQKEKAKYGKMIEEFEAERVAKMGGATKKKVVKKKAVVEEVVEEQPVEEKKNALAKATKKKIVKKTATVEEAAPAAEEPAAPAKTSKKKIIKKTVVADEAAPAAVEEEAAPAKTTKKKIIKKTMMVEQAPAEEVVEEAPKTTKKKIIKKTIMVEQQPEPEAEEVVEEPVVKTTKKKVIKKTIMIEQPPEPEAEEEVEEPAPAKTTKKKIIKKTILVDQPAPVEEDVVEEAPAPKTTKKKIIKKTIL